MTFRDFWNDWLMMHDWLKWKEADIACQITFKKQIERFKCDKISITIFERIYIANMIA